jgi:hypothetical protein
MTAFAEVRFVDSSSESPPDAAIDTGSKPPFSRDTVLVAPLFLLRISIEVPDVNEPGDADT